MNEWNDKKVFDLLCQMAAEVRTNGYGPNSVTVSFVKNFLHDKGITLDLKKPLKIDPLLRGKNYPDDPDDYYGGENYSGTGRNLPG